MKTSLKILTALLAFVCCYNAADAQSSKADKKAQKAAEMSKIINSMNYDFKADRAMPLTGPTKQLSGDYGLTVTKEKLVVFLPYFGRAYAAPMDASDGGVKLNTTRFDYKADQDKKGGWTIVIKPKEKASSGSKDVQTLRLTVSADGYASLQVTSLNRDPISFSGNVEQEKKEK